MRFNWDELAERFTAITDTVDLIGHWTPSQTVAAARWILRADLDHEVRFKSLARFAVLALGEPDGPDAYARWLDRVAAALDLGSSASGLPAAVRGLNHLAASHCRQLQVESDIKGMSPEPSPIPAPKPRRAAWIQQRRLAKGWSAYQLSQHGSVDVRTVAKIERGENVQDAALERIAAALGCNPREIPAD